MQFREYITPKGVRTLLIKAPGSTAASIQVWFKAGSALENDKNRGIAHFLEHMFFKGTEKRPGSKIAEEVETFGGEINAFTSFDYTCYFINCPKNKVKKSVEILMDMVANPLFSASEISPEREVVLEELKRSLDSSSQYSFLQLQKEAFKGPYSFPILGTKETITNFSRKQLLQFRNSYYNMTNMMVVVAGDFDESIVLKTIDSFNFVKGKESKLPEFIINTPGKVCVHQKETQMCQLTMSIQGMNYMNPEAAPEDLAINCLGHGETSPLYRTLVTESTTANYASSTTMYMAKGSTHLIRVNFPFDGIKEVYKILSDTLKNAIQIGFTNKEIEKIQNQYIASKIYEKESLEGFSFTLGNSFAQTGDFLCEQKFIEMLNEANAENVNQSIKDIFQRDIHFSLQIPKTCDMLSAKRETNQLSKTIAKLVRPQKVEEKISGLVSKYDPQVKKIELKNGISLIYRYNNITPTFAMHIYTRGGLTKETLATNGAYNLISSLLTRGHKKADNDELKQYLEDNTASLNGFSGKNAYGMTMHGMTKYTVELFEHFFNSFFNPLFPAKFLAHEKELSLRALKMQEEDPVKHCFENFSNLVFKDHPYALNSIGTIKSLNLLTRKSLLEIHKKNINENEILMTYCGNLKIKEVKDLIEKHIHDIPPRKKTKIEKHKLTPISGETIEISFPREQTHILIGIPTRPLGNRENIYLKMLSAHLGGQSSELFVEVRDRQGLCYSAQPINFMAMEAGYWAIYMATGNDKVERAIEAIESIIEKIKNNGISQKEFKRIKSMIKGQEEINIQTNEDYANIYSVPTLQGLGLDYFYKNSEIIDSVSYDDFRENISKILSRKFNKVIVGEIKNR